MARRMGEVSGWGLRFTGGRQPSAVQCAGLTTIIECGAVVALDSDPLVHLIQLVLAGERGLPVTPEAAEQSCCHSRVRHTSSQ